MKRLVLILTGIVFAEPAISETVVCSTTLVCNSSSHLCHMTGEIDKYFGNWSEPGARTTFYLSEVSTMSRSDSATSATCTYLTNFGGSGYQMSLNSIRNINTKANLNQPNNWVLSNGRAHCDARSRNTNCPLTVENKL